MSVTTKPEIAEGQTWATGSLRVKILSVLEDGRVHFSSSLHPEQTMHVTDFQAWISSVGAVRQDVHGWQRHRGLIFILTESVDSRGKPVMENDFTVRVEPGRGRSPAEAEALAEKIKRFLNSEI